MTNDNDARGALKDEWAPKRIWLQKGVGEDGSHTWCEDSQAPEHEEASYIREDFTGTLSADYLSGHQDGLDWAAQLTEQNDPRTGDWMYDDPHDLAKAIRKGPDMSAYAQKLPAGDGLTDEQHAVIKRAREELRACQAVIHLAGGFDSAYVKGAQASMAELDALLAAPRQPGEMVAKCTRCEYIGKCDCQPGEMGAGVDIKSWLHSINDDGYRTDNERMAARILLNAPGIVIPAASAQQDEREARTLADWLKLAPATWDAEYANLWAQLQVAQERVMEYRARWKGAKQVQADAGAVAWRYPYKGKYGFFGPGDTVAKEFVKAAEPLYTRPAAESDKRDASYKKALRRLLTAVVALDASYDGPGSVFAMALDEQRAAIEEARAAMSREQSGGKS